MSDEKREEEFWETRLAEAALAERKDPLQEFTREQWIAAAYLRVVRALHEARATIATYPATPEEMDRMEREAFLRGRGVGEKYGRGI